MSQAGALSSGSTPPSVATSYVTDAGTAIPVGNVLNVLGDGTITTSGSGNTIVIHDGATPSPAKTLTLVDDFIASTNEGLYAWSVLGTVLPVNGTASHPGLFQVNPVASSQGIALNDSGATIGSFVVGGGAISLNFVISLVTLSEVANRYISTFGLYDAVSSQGGTLPIDGIYFSYSDDVNGGNWLLNCTASSVTTSVDSGIAAGTGFVNLGIVVNAAGTSVSFTINGASVGSAIVGNIPSAVISPSMLWINSSGNIPASLIDLFYLTNTLTVSR